MSEYEVEASPVTKVASDLTEILSLYNHLRDQAAAKSNHALMPGGPAMAALGNIANLEAWGHMQQATERYEAGVEGYRRAYTSAEDEDPEDAWSSFQLLEFWSEDWRRIHEAEYDQRPTIASEAGFLRWTLNWAWDNEPRWDDFAKDVRTAKKRLEEILYAGERSQRGAPCMYDECRGVRLTRKLEPYAVNGEKAWRWSKWHCVKCHREWDEDQYARSVAAAAWASQSEEIDGEVWCSPKYAARQVDRPETTIRAWASKGLLATLCVLRGRRSGFVRLADVEARHAQSKIRRVKRVA